MFENNDFVIEILKSSGVITSKALEDAKLYSEQNEKDILVSLIELKYIAEYDVSKTLARHFGMQMVQLSSLELTPEIISLIPEEIAKRYKVIPLGRKGEVMQIAIANPLSLEVIDTLKFLLKCEIEAVVAAPSDISNAVDQYYIESDFSKQLAVDNLMEQMENTGVDVVGGITFLSESDGDEATADEAPIIKLVSLIITQAFQMHASDIHIEPLERKLRVRYRIDGVLREVDSPPKRLQSSILSRLKIMSKMTISEKRLPQDGRIKIIIAGKHIDLRVSSIPTSHGESIVMRILDKSSLLVGLSQLGFLSDDETKFQELIGMPNGIILITGPTGSGKTTTLYSCLNFLNRSDRKIITVEDPIEYQLSGINQVQVQEGIGLTFSAVLRSILRQAPNIIMVGEIRDVETAEIAINAALTGHLVFSTLHTNDAAGAFTRLIDQGVKPFLVASSIQGVIAQRLIRTICQACKQPHTPSQKELMSIGISPDMIKEQEFSIGRGCEKCNGSGYKGRIGVFEIVLLNDEIRELIYRQNPSNVIAKKARELGMRALIEDGRLKVIKGMTTVSEILRVAQAEDILDED